MEAWQTYARKLYEEVWRRETASPPSVMLTMTKQQWHLIEQFYKEVRKG